MSDYKPGDLVEVIHSVEWQNERRKLDIEKGNQLGSHFFMGNAAAYLHTNESYVVESVTENGGLKLRGFAATVSTKDVRPGTKPVRR